MDNTLPISFSILYLSSTKLVLKPPSVTYKKKIGSLFLLYTDLFIERPLWPESPLLDIEDLEVNLEYLALVKNQLSVLQCCFHSEKEFKIGICINLIFSCINLIFSSINRNFIWLFSWLFMCVFFSGQSELLGRI